MTGKTFVIACLFLLAMQDVAAAGDGREAALVHKGQGDRFAAQGDYGKATEEYLSALSLDAAAFNGNEKFRMAVTLSWAGKLEDAISVLRSVIAENPKNHDARVHLARVLSWTGRSREAEEEADAVLAEFPDSEEALLVKANVLRWRGDTRGAASFYRKILSKKEDFDARLGLAYAELEFGDRTKAAEDAGLLKPENANQAKELDSLQKALNETGRPSASLTLNRYRDSDGNRVDTYGLSSGFPVGAVQSDFAYRQVHAFDGTGSASAEEASVKTYYKKGRIGAGGGVGLVHAGQDQAPYIATGHVKAGTNVQGWLAGAAASKDFLTDTAQLIRNRINQKSGELFASRDFPFGYALSGSYRNSEYSDDNRSRDLLLLLNRAFFSKNPAVTAGYQFRYLDFDRTSGGGYFDPQHLNSNRIQTTVSADAGRFHGSLEPTLGYQEFSRFGARNYQVVYSVHAAAGYTIRKNVSFEISGESGKNGVGIVSAYKYSIIQAGLTATF